MSRGRSFCNLNLPMESKLNEAAIEGSVSTFLELLQQDELILDKVVMNRLSQTPLHVAALRGHVNFVKEILRQMPQLAGELDWRRSSPLHIASQKGYIDIVKVLVQVNPGMCLGRDVDGRNPLHLAAMNGQVDVLEELVRVKPLAAYALTTWGETILHLCVKYNQLESLKLLLENRDVDPHFLNAKDDYGMNILHLAVADKQIEVIRFLTTSTKVEVNAFNANGFTALDVLAQSKRDVKDGEIWELLRQAEAISVKDIRLSASNNLISQENNQTPVLQPQGQGSQNFLDNQQGDWLEKVRNTLMVVASLIATMAFQAVINPPHRLLENQNASRSESEIPTSEPPTAQSSTISNNDYDYEYYSHKYKCFTFFNTTGFMASVSIILLLISGLPLKRKFFMWILMIIMWVAITAMTWTYLISMYFFLDHRILSPDTSAIAISLIWICFVGILLLSHIIRGMMKIKYLRKLVKRRRGHSI